MEYIDGEDLASLMKRIGHLSNEKALDIARQLVAGLTVAHERGVLHRDLKPANIMLDGHGRVRITDFGLAIAVGDETQAEEIAGTPAYMAPEQLAGKGATIRSDIYSLGLILYEIYTGKKAFKATTLAELREQKETQTPRAPSEIREGIDPVVERVIQRCMEKDPNARPASVAQLAQALPGGDPLAAAIAAGETPSPEMVAASGSKEGLHPAIAWTILALIIAGTIASLVITDHFYLHRRISFEKSPELLVAKAREIIEKAGYPEEFADSAHGFIQNDDLIKYIADSDKSADKWEKLDSKAILFWYMQSPNRLQNIVSTFLGQQNPSLQSPGEIIVTLDAEGRFVSLRAFPLKGLSPTETAPVFDWPALFTVAGFDYDQWKPDGGKSHSFSYADTMTAWRSSLSDQPELPNRIEAASFHGKPVSFEIIYPWTSTTQTGAAEENKAESIRTIANTLFLVTIILGGILFARRNLRRGRGDRRNAKRLALLVTGLLFLIVLLVRPSSVGQGLLVIPWVAGFFWILYIAIEPFIRRRWPQILVSWTRLMSKEWKDPLVARDIFVGCAFGVCVWATVFPYFSLVGRFTVWPPMGLAAFMGIDSFASVFLVLIFSCLLTNLGLVGLLLFLRVILRNDKATIAASVLLLALTMLTRVSIWGFIYLLVLSAIVLFVLMRFGFLAACFSNLTALIFYNLPITLEASAWFKVYGYVALAIFAAIVLYAFYYSLGGRPMFGTPQLDD
jgi:serine/threonine protein kinase